MIPLEFCVLFAPDTPIGITQMVIDGGISRGQRHSLLKIVHGLIIMPELILRPAQTIDNIAVIGPQFDGAAMSAQKELWSLQGLDRIWYCGAYFGSGFHEDGLQSGLAVAEKLGGGRRPWTVQGESDRVFLPAAAPDWALA